MKGTNIRVSHDSWWHEVYTPGKQWWRKYPTLLREGLPPPPLTFTLLLSHSAVCTDPRLHQLHPFFPSVAVAIFLLCGMSSFSPPPRISLSVSSAGTGCFLDSLVTLLPLWPPSSHVVLTFKMAVFYRPWSLCIYSSPFAESNNIHNNFMLARNSIKLTANWYFENRIPVNMYFFFLKSDTYPFFCISDWLLSSRVWLGVICPGTDQVTILNFSNYHDKKRHFNLNTVDQCLWRSTAHIGHTIAPGVTDFGLGAKLSDALTHSCSSPALPFEGF